MIHCASLVYIEDGKVFLVRVRNNTLWYFPGGKIAEGEDAASALLRELYEELTISVTIEDIRFLTDIIGPSHDGGDLVHLYLYTMNTLPPCTPGNEVSETGWFSLSETHSMAPAVIKTLRYIHHGL
ncbi:NUDIX domain-containing protein (plasmid) [Chimaeribacter arupi]|uniref:NUDIX hydrolase n=1 Tax=Chimaeribacter arupi TaxID=2060066 RepID=UPI002712114D|nr:NUDIX domain-containing protein [Chimaeribacter arupi]WKZ94922.1 NUDIX domain-containing protein [Chimaeribacter arupi]